MHTSHSLFRDGGNAFFDAEGAVGGSSPVALHYIAGLLRHARAFCAVTNPLVNSYKRLVPGYEAPVHVAWSMRNRSPLDSDSGASRRRDARAKSVCPILRPDPRISPSPCRSRPGWTASSSSSCRPIP